MFVWLKPCFPILFLWPHTGINLIFVDQFRFLIVDSKFNRIYINSISPLRISFLQTILFVLLFCWMDNQFLNILSNFRSFQSSIQRKNLKSYFKFSFVCQWNWNLIKEEENVKRNFLSRHHFNIGMIYFRLIMIESDVLLIMQCHYWKCVGRNV